MMCRHTTAGCDSIQTSGCATIAAAIVALGLVGCGGGSTPAEAPQPAQNQSAAPAAPAASQPAASQQIASQPPQAVDPARKETKWIGKIPYDVFYDDPLSVAADATQLSPVTTTGGGAPEMPAPPSAAPAPTTPAPASSGSQTASSGAIDWEVIVPAALLNEQFKVMRTRLTKNLQTVGSFNRGVTEISIDGSILAALARVVEEHPGDISWKEKAPYVRDLAYEVYSNADGSGRTPFDKTKLPFEQIITILNGGPPPEMEADPKVSFADVSYLGEMMQRIEATFNAVKANINTEARMKEDPEDVRRNLHLLATLGTIMGTDGYDSAEEEQYQAFVKTFVDGALEASKNVQAENFDGFQAALNQIQTSCGECHQRYRGASSAF